MLSGYEYIRTGKKSVLTRTGNAVLSALLDGANVVAENTGGRAAVLRFHLPDGGSGMIRDYRRGGLLRHVNHAGYLSNRPLAELRVVDFLWNTGFAVPEPLGICWWRRNALLYGRIATRAIDAMHLQEYLETQAEPSPIRLGRVGEMVRQMHELGVFHADLQVRNILLAEEGPYLIDFDKSRRFATLPVISRARNLFRLRRSFEKNGLDMRWCEMILAGYGEAPNHPIVSFMYNARSRLSSLGNRK